MSSPSLWACVGSGSRIMNDGNVGTTICRSIVARLRWNAESAAPRAASSGGSVWLPFMMGYMLAPRYGSGVFTQPLYRPSHDPNRFYTSGSGRVGAVSANGRTRVAKSQTRQPRARTRTVARGGFGARAYSSAS